MANVKLSAHFSMNEFQCSCGGKYAGCKRTIVNMQLVNGLEKLRKKFYSRGLNIRSSYRCEKRNREVGGAASSQHRTGKAVDIDPVASWKEVKAMGIFTGIGYRTEDGKVTHVDVRPGNPANPTIWTYTNGKTDSPNRHRS